MNNLFKFLTKKRVPENWTCMHPSLINEVEPAFKAGGVQYYRMKSEIHMPYGRYKEVASVLYEVELRMSAKMLKDYLSKLKDFLGGSKGTVELEKAFRLIWAMESRLELQFEVETARKLATLVYFDATESLISYDPEYAKKKLQIWDKEESYDFFLAKPMSELLGLNDISKDSLVDFINRQGDLLKELTFEQPKAL